MTEQQAIIKIGNKAKENFDNATPEEQEKALEILGDHAGWFTEEEFDQMLGERNG